MTRKNHEVSVRLGVIGSGFGADFYFHLHPNCEVVAVASKMSAERKKLQNIYKCKTAYDDMSALLKDEAVDAVAIFTPVPDHAPHIIASMKHGKHVLCAVPVGLSIEECYDVKLAVNQAQKVFMMAETTYYRQDTITARKFFQNKEFGKLMKVDASYHHPGLEEYFFDAEKQATWRHGLAPMLYSTHCTAFLLGVSTDVIRSVSCVGWDHDNKTLENNRYNNRYWNQSALFDTNNGTIFNLEVNWRGAFSPTERCSWFGEKMSYLGPDSITSKSYLIHSTSKLGNDDAGFLNYQPRIEEFLQPNWWETDLLPKELQFESGHFGSHTFITHEFIDSIINGRKPSIDIELAINMTLPGIIANESAKRGGERLNIPQFHNL